MKRVTKRNLLGRDPAMGRVAFATGAVLTRKDRLRNRNSKQARKEIRRQLSGE